MKPRHLPILLAVAAVVVPALARADDDETVRTLTGELSAAGAEGVRVTAPVGEFRIDATASSTVSVTLEVRCRRPASRECRRRAEGIELSTVHDRDVATVAVRGWPKQSEDGLSLALRMKTPRELELVGEFGVGELTVGGLAAGARLELGVGEVAVEAAASGVRRAHLEVGVGEASLVVGGRRIEGKGFIGREIDWSGGRGRHLIDVECGVGEIEVRLVD